ncbi:MAG TPA: hypothetical protein VIJ16_04700 [Gemmatimonadaceae bacterium]
MIPTETRERFIVDVTGQMPGAEIFEMHFFSPRRVAGVESAVAVIAARVPVVPPLADSPEAAEPVESVEAAPSDRYTVFSATYKHTLKGPDRGKWEVSVKAEADAPLVTVDQVVRGVQRRAEDAEIVDRLTGDEVRAVAAAHQPAAE